ncbi:hypothetical protein ACFXPA_46895 [Amycolatopsis sp. NPDC059090]|uniref:hypothetical protein n=1 Tax=unclassified Amycolatopsis TaxID=2618356 RepID=UPI0036708F0C
MSTSGGPQDQPGTPQEPGAVPPGWQAPPPGAGYPQQPGAQPGQSGYPQQPGQSPQFGQPVQQYPGQSAPGAYPGQAGQYPGQPAPGSYPGQGGQPGQGQFPGQPQPGQPQPGQPQPGQPSQPQPALSQPGHPQPGQPQAAQPQPQPGQPYPGQAAYPGQGYPAQQPGYPAQPQQPGAGYAAPQPGQGYPAQGQPLTSPGLGAIPVALGGILEIVALFVPWVTFTNGAQSASVSFIDAFTKIPSGSDSFASMYVRFLAFILIAGTLGATLPWVLGALRTKKSAYWLSGIRRRELTPSSFWWYRTVFAGRATVLLLFHIAGIIAMFYDDLSLIGLGAYLLVVGGLLVVAGAAIGPKLNAAR